MNDQQRSANKVAIEQLEGLVSQLKSGELHAESFEVEREVAQHDQPVDSKAWFYPTGHAEIVLKISSPPLMAEHKRLGGTVRPR